jgi:hypothetical protein
MAGATKLEFGHDPPRWTSEKERRGAALRIYNSAYLSN